MAKKKPERQPGLASVATDSMPGFIEWLEHWSVCADNGARECKAGEKFDSTGIQAATALYWADVAKGIRWVTANLRQAYDLRRKKEAEATRERKHDG